MLRGKFGKQMSYIMAYLHNEVDLAQESVAFLLPKGGRWFSEIEKYLQRSGLEYLHIKLKNPIGRQEMKILPCVRFIQPRGLSLIM